MWSLYLTRHQLNDFKARPQVPDLDQENPERVDRQIPNSAKPKSKPSSKAVSQSASSSSSSSNQPQRSTSTVTSNYNQPRYQLTSSVASPSSPSSSLSSSASSDSGPKRYSDYFEQNDTENHSPDRKKRRLSFWQLITSSPVASYISEHSSEEIEVLTGAESDLINQIESQSSQDQELQDDNISINISRSSSLRNWSIRSSDQDFGEGDYDQEYVVDSNSDYNSRQSSDSDISFVHGFDTQIEGAQPQAKPQQKQQQAWTRRGSKEQKKPVLLVQNQKSIQNLKAKQKWVQQQSQSQAQQEQQRELQKQVESLKDDVKYLKNQQVGFEQDQQYKYRDNYQQQWTSEQQEYEIQNWNQSLSQTGGTLTQEPYQPESETTQVTKSKSKAAGWNLPKLSIGLGDRGKDLVSKAIAKFKGEHQATEESEWNARKQALINQNDNDYDSEMSYQTWTQGFSNSDVEHSANQNDVYDAGDNYEHGYDSHNGHDDTYGYEVEQLQGHGQGYEHSYNIEYDQEQDCQQEYDHNHTSRHEDTGYNNYDDSDQAWYHGGDNQHEHYENDWDEYQNNDYVQRHYDDSTVTNHNYNIEEADDISYWQSPHHEENHEIETNHSTYKNNSHNDWDNNFQDQPEPQPYHRSQHSAVLTYDNDSEWSTDHDHDYNSDINEPVQYRKRQIHFGTIKSSDFDTASQSSLMSSGRISSVGSVVSSANSSTSFRAGRENLNQNQFQESSNIFAENGKTQRLSSEEIQQQQHQQMLFHKQNSSERKNLSLKSNKRKTPKSNRGLLAPVREESFDLENGLDNLSDDDQMDYTDEQTYLIPTLDHTLQQNQRLQLQKANSGNFKKSGNHGNKRLTRQQMQNQNQQSKQKQPNKNIKINLRKQNSIAKLDSQQSQLQLGSAYSDLNGEDSLNNVSLLSGNTNNSLSRSNSTISQQSKKSKSTNSTNAKGGCCRASNCCMCWVLWSFLILVTILVAGAVIVLFVDPWNWNLLSKHVKQTNQSGALSNNLQID